MILSIIGAIYSGFIAFFVAFRIAKIVYHKIRRDQTELRQKRVAYFVEFTL